MAWPAAAGATPCARSVENHRRSHRSHADSSGCAPWKAGRTASSAASAIAASASASADAAAAESWRKKIV